MGVWAWVLGVVAIVCFLVIAFSVGRTAWRLLVLNEEPVAGGSMGRQFFGRHARKR
jgi:hypothetical protein